MFNNYVDIITNYMLLTHTINGILSSKVKVIISTITYFYIFSPYHHTISNYVF